jgi:hypothetical protein
MSSGDDDDWEDPAKMNQKKTKKVVDKAATSKQKKARKKAQQTALLIEKKLRRTIDLQNQRIAKMEAGSKPKHEKAGVQKGSKRKTGSELWKNPKWYLTKVRQDKELGRLLLAAGMNPTSPVGWQYVPVLNKPAAMKVKHNPGYWSRRVKCPFVVECKCPVEFKIVYEPRREEKGLPAYGLFTRQDTPGKCIEHSHEGFNLTQGVPRLVKNEMTAERLHRGKPLAFIRLLGQLESTKHLKIQGEFDPEWEPNKGMEYCVSRSQIINCFNRKKEANEKLYSTIEISAEVLNT